MQHQNTESLMEDVKKRIIHGNYRNAAEVVLERMKELAEFNGDTGTVEEIESILEKMYDLPNIDWGKAEKRGIYGISNFVR